jgi:hypothetical protein
LLPTIQKNTLEFVRLSRLYAARRSAHAALAAYPTLDALLSALHGPRRADHDTRCRLLCAVIAGHQAVASPLWVAVVLCAFRGMLVNLSSKLMGVDRDEADVYVAAALIEAMGRVRPQRDPDRIGMYVRQETRRVVFAALGRDARARQYWPEDEEESCGLDAAEDVDRGDDAMDDETVRDPLALERASRHIDPDALADPESLVPLEDRLFFYGPTVDGVPDEYVRRAHAVPGGLRRLADHLFADASARERENAYRRLVRRAQRLPAEGE